MQIEKIQISKLKNNTGQVPGLPKNPRFIKDDKYQQLVKSLQEDPEMMQLREIIAYSYNDELIVICGNMRLRALKELGEKETFVKILPPDTSVEKLKAYTIKDNVGFGSHDWDMLANEWEVEQLSDWGLDVVKPENGLQIEDNSEAYDLEEAKELDFFDKFVIIKFKNEDEYHEFILKNNVKHVQTSNMQGGKDTRIDFKTVFDYEDLRSII